MESYRHSISDADYPHTVEASAAKRRMRNSLQYAREFGAEEVALSVLEELMDSASGEELGVALAAAIGMSYDTALVRFTTELASSPMAANESGDILVNLGNSYTPKQGTGRFERLIRENQKLKIDGLDSALAAALRRVEDKTKLRLAALLLDSPDEQAVRRAAGHFYKYASLAREGSAHPYKHTETKTHSGREESQPASAQADFWRRWWAEHQQSLIL